MNENRQLIKICGMFGGNFYHWMHIFKKDLKLVYQTSILEMKKKNKLSRRKEKVEQKSMKSKTGNWEKSIKPKAGSLKKISKINKSLPRIRKERGHKLLIPEMKEDISLQSPWTLKLIEAHWTILCPQIW